MGRREATGDAELGARVRAAREALGWTQLDLAVYVGERTTGEPVTQSAISQIETGYVMPAVDTLAAIAEGLGVDVGWLTSGSGMVADELAAFEKALWSGLSRRALRRLHAMTDAERERIV